MNPRRYPSSRRRRAANGDHVVVVAHKPNSPVIAGYASGRTQPDGDAYIDFIAVAPNDQRTGIGRQLVIQLTRCLIDSAPNRRLSLTVHEHRSGAQAFYSTLGFTIDVAIASYSLHPTGADTRSANSS